MPKLALFDMDDTLFNYSLQMRLDILALASPTEDADELRDTDIFQLIKKYPHIERRAEVIKTIPGWWRDLPPYRPGWRLFDLATKIGYCTKIITKGPRSKSHAWAEKLDCITEHFGPDQPIDIVGKDKAGIYGRVLVDDYPHYVDQWLEHRPRGLAILPAQPCNAGYHHPNAIRFHTESDENNETVRKMLQAAYDRESKQHWKDLL